MDSPESPSTKRIRIETSASDSDLITSKSAFASKICRKQYLDEKTADIHFMCGKQRERVPAHKCILSKASDAFDNMFYGPLAEPGDIHLPDTSPAAFKDFLQFCYLDEVNLDLEHIVEIMDLTNKYCMPECLVVCGKFWAKHLTFDDICWAYHWAIFFGEAEFREFCERKISAYPQLVFESSSFLRCEFIVLKHILEIDSLLCDESIVLGACLNWARFACKRDGLNPKSIENLRVYLKDALYKIRYGSMTFREFREHMDANDGLFDDIKEYEDIIRLLSGSMDLKTGRFNPNPRSSNIFLWNEDRVLKCKTNNSNSSVFTCNKPMLLGGFYCAPLSLETNWHTTEADMTITEEPKTMKSNGTEKHAVKVIYCKRVQLKANDETFIDFKRDDDCGGNYGRNGDVDNDVQQPIIIRPEFKYRINFKPSGSNQFERIVYHQSREIKLDDETLVKFPQEGGGDDRAIVKSFKFNRL